MSNATAPIRSEAALKSVMVRARPLAKTTVVTPISTAAKVRALRAGRAKGSPRPMLTERGSREPASLRCTFRPPAALGRRARGDRRDRRHARRAPRRDVRGQADHQRHPDQTRRVASRLTTGRPPSEHESLLQQRRGDHAAEREPTTVPATAGTAMVATYTRTTWRGVKPMVLKTPMSRYPETTAPLTTFSTISTATAAPARRRR